MAINMDQEGKLKALSGFLFLATVVVLFMWNGVRKENNLVSLIIKGILFVERVDNDMV